MSPIVAQNGLFAHESGGFGAEVVDFSHEKSRRLEESSADLRIFELFSEGRRRYADEIRRRK